MDGDFSEFRALAADLTNAGNDIGRFVDKALKVTATNVKNDWREGAETSAGEGFTEAYPRSIFFDMKYGPGGITAEIGPELGRPGGSAGFREEAPGDVLSSPTHAGRDALEANEDDFIRGLEIAIADSLGVVFE